MKDTEILLYLALFVIISLKLCWHFYKDKMINILFFGFLALLAYFIFPPLGSISSFLIAYAIAMHLQDVKEDRQQNRALENFLTPEEKKRMEIKKAKHEAWLKRRAERAEKKRIEEFREEIRRFEKSMGL